MRWPGSEDELEVHLIISELRSKVITYTFEFWNQNATPPLLVGTGKLTTVCVSTDENGRMTATAIPPRIAELLKPHVTD